MKRVDGTRGVCFNYLTTAKQWLPVFTASILGLVLFSGAAFAQDQTVPEGDTAAEVPVATEAPPEVAQDFAVTLQDLGTSEARILPDSPLHVFKRFGWGVQEAFTFDAVADAELKFRHANQQLAEVKQLVDERGVEGVSADVINSAIDRFESKFEDVKATTAKLKNAKADNAAEVERVLDEVADKQIKHRQVLSDISDEVVQAKKLARDTGEDSSAGLEQVMAHVSDTKEKTIGDFTELLTGVEDEPDQVRVRITRALDKQAGSEFKEFANLEILEAMRDSAPATVKEALAQAKKNTIQKFEVRIANIPEAVRTQKFSQYLEHATMDETRLLGLLEEIKRSSGISDDVLAKIEEAKEITIRKFGEKLSLTRDGEVRERFFRSFDTDDISDLIALEEFKNRMTADSAEFKETEEVYNRSFDAFKARFRDAESEDQAARFEKLSGELLANPSPKTFKLIASLETEVRADPAKSEFLNQMEQAMTQQFETQFRRGGDKFLNQVATLDPSDLAVFADIQIGDDFRDQFVRRNTEQYKAFMQDVSEPEAFDRFHERFFNVPEFVINDIRARDSEFQGALQFKVRKVEQQKFERARDIARAALDYEEREVNFQVDRVQRQEEEVFFEKLNQIPWEDFTARKALWEEKIDNQVGRSDEVTAERKRIFEARMNNDPWCDSACRQIQLTFLEQEARHEKERLADDLMRERNRIERERKDFKDNNPLAGKCTTPEQCEEYCRTNQGSRGCEWAVVEHTFKDCGPGGYFDDRTKQCVYRSEVDLASVSCAPGQYWNGNSCASDPYYRPPETFRTCGLFQKWNEAAGRCEASFNCPLSSAPVRACSQGEQPKPPDPNNPCGQPSCIQQQITICPDLSAASPLPCVTGFVREIAKDSQGCARFGECVSSGGTGGCPDAYNPVCGSNEKTYDNDCKARVAGVSVKYFGQCGTVIQECSGGQFWESQLKKCLNSSDYVPYVKGKCERGWVWQSEGYCKQDSSVVGNCPLSCTSSCSGGSYCLYDNFGCAKGCSPTCAPGDYYDQFLGKCSAPAKPAPEPGSGNWVNKTWSFSDGQTESSYVLNRTDSEYVNFLAGVAAQCKKIPKANFAWKSNAGDDTDWRNFGIPDCSKSDYTAETCGNAFCGTGETLDSCPSDCANGRTTETCGNAFCGSGETSQSCPSDCTASPATTCPATKYNNYASNFSCSYTACPAGCSYDGTGCATGCYTAPSCSPNQYNNQTTSTSCNYKACPNGCNYNTTGCPVSCLSSGGVCPINAYNNNTGSYSCSYSKCPSGCTYSAAGCPSSCKTDACGDGICGSSESSTSCAADCGGTASGYCGDGKCGTTETSSSCPNDCGGTSSAYEDTQIKCADGIDNDSDGFVDKADPSCSAFTGGSTTTFCDNDGACESNESYASCPADCSGGGNAYAGDANSCPGFAYSRWDSTGARYCQLNNSVSCEFFYPAYLTESNYSALECPASSSTWSSSSSCETKYGSGWHTMGSDGNCFDTNMTQYYTTGGTLYSCSATPAVGCSSTGGTGQYGSCGTYASQSSCTGASNCCWYNNTSNSSSSYCYYSSSGCSSSGSYTSETCGNNYCGSGETGSSCPSDCGSTGGGTAASCPSTVYNNNTTTYSCNNAQCPSGCTYDSAGCPSGCYQSTASTGWCGDASCNNSETSSSCPADCGTVQGAQASRTFVKPEFNPFRVFAPLKSFLGL